MISLDFKIIFLVKNFTIIECEVDVEHNKLINIYCILIEGCSWNSQIFFVKVK